MRAHLDLQPKRDHLLDAVLESLSAVVAENVFVQGGKGGSYRLSGDI